MKTYAKTKEIDPVGGHLPAAPPPGSTNDDSSDTVNVEDIDLGEAEDEDDSPIPLSQNTHQP